MAVVDGEYASNWYEQKGDVQDFLIASFDDIMNRTRYKNVRDVEHLRMYGGFDLIGSDFQTFNYASPSALFRRKGWNIIQSATNTLISRITKSKPRPEVLTINGTWEDKQQAEQINKFLNGIFQATDVYAKARSEIFRWACISGTGLLKIFDAGSKIKIETIFPWELAVDPNDSLYGQPNCAIHSRIVSKKLLAAQFPKKKDIIEHSAVDQINNMVNTYVHNFQDQVSVYEGWRLPVGETKGRRVLCVSGGVLEDEEWESPDFPFVAFSFSRRPVGFWGIGVSEILLGIQYRINEVNDRIEESMKWAVPFWSVENGANIPDGHLNTNIGNIIRFNRTPATVQVPNTVSPVLLDERRELWAKGFEILGLNQLAAAAQVPNQFRSGAALREYRDTQTIRFAEVEQAWEEFFQKVADQFIYASQRIAEREEDFKVAVREEGMMTEINWKDLDFNRDKYKVLIASTSFLPLEPAARIETMQDMVMSGTMDRDEFWDKLDLPDTERFRSIKFSAQHAIDKVIEHEILKKGIPMKPEAFDMQNIDYAILHASQIYHEAQIDNAPEDRLQLLRDYISAAIDMKNMAAQPPEQPQVAPPPPEPAPGAAPVTGQAIPGVTGRMP